MKLKLRQEARWIIDSLMPRRSTKKQSQEIAELERAISAMVPASRHREVWDLLRELEAVYGKLAVQGQSDAFTVGWQLGRSPDAWLFTNGDDDTDGLAIHLADVEDYGE